MHCSFWSPFGFYNTCDTESPGPIRKQKDYKSCSSEELQSLPEPPAEGQKKLPVFLETKEMILPIVFLCLAAVLSPSTGQVPDAFPALLTTNTDQQKLIVDKHNALRRGVNPTASNMLRMEWNLAAATNAQNWANQCSLNHSPSSQRRTNVDCGENLYMSTAPSSWSDAIQAWYDEVKDFKYGVGATTEGAVIGHYTQVVWYKSYQIGCAVAYCPKSTYKYFYVCQYCPAGNRVDLMKTPYKEGKPCGDCPNACDNGLCKMGPITAVLCLVALIHQAEAQVYQSKQVDTPLFPPFPVKYPIQKPVKKPIQKPIYKPVQKPIHKQIPIQKPVQLPPIKKPVQVPAIKKPVYVPPVKKPVYVPPVKKPVYVPPVKKPARLPPIKKPQQPQQPQQPAQQKYNGFQMQSKQQMLQQQNIIQLKNKQVILKEHNQIRRSVVPTARNMLKMVWNERAAKNAQKWAKKCEMEISPTDQRVIDGITCGENILLSSQPKTWAETIQVWNSQGSNFKYGFGATTKNANVKSYAQLVWYNSYQVGCAVAYCPRNQYNYFYVCHYCPPGNNIMQVAAPYKSGPRCADCPGHCDNGLCTNPCRHRDAFPNCKNMRTLFGCRHPVVREKCAATCKCTTQIV